MLNQFFHYRDQFPEWFINQLCDLQKAMMIVIVGKHVHHGVFCLKSGILYAKCRVEAIFTNCGSLSTVDFK